MRLVRGWTARCLLEMIRECQWSMRIVNGQTERHAGFRPGQPAYKRGSINYTKALSSPLLGRLQFGKNFTFLLLK